MKLTEKIKGKLKEAAKKKRYVATIIQPNGEFRYSRAHKEGGHWMIGGDYARASAGSKIFVHDLDGEKSYVLMGKFLKFSDNIGSYEKDNLEKAYKEMQEQ